MSDKLDDKLREIIKPWAAEMTDDVVAQLKAAFAGEGYLTPAQAEQTQELVNKIVQTAQDMAKLPVTVREVGTMTGAEWLARFQRRMDEYDRTELETKSGPVDFMAIPVVMEAARRAAGIELMEDKG